MMKRLPIQIVLILACGILLGVINNTLSSGRIPWIQDYHIPADGDDENWIPFSWDPARDTVFTLLNSNKAYQQFEKNKAIFIDARMQEEFIEGHISGAINIDFEGDAELFDYQVSQLHELAGPDVYLITYCAGTECDASLMLARNLYFSQGYSNIAIFFGGWEQWIEKGYPIEEGIE